MSEHTKGKLSLNNYHFPYQYLVIRTGPNDNDSNPGKRLICHISGNNKPKTEAEANAARLMKCWNLHDELVEALKKAESYLRVRTKKQSKFSIPRLVDKIIEECQAVLAEAEKE